MTAQENKLLFVDDDPTIRKALSVVFKYNKIPHSIADSGEEALEMLEKEDFALVVSDIGIPGMGGLEFGRRLRKQYPDLPIIAFTGSAVGEKSVEEVFDTVFEKPRDLDNLIDEVRKLTAANKL